MTVKTHVLETTDEIVCLGFSVTMDSESDQLDAVYRAMASIPGAKVGYLDSKKFRADIPAPLEKPKTVV